MFGKFVELLFNDIFVIIVTVFVTLGAEHGFSWVVGKIKAYQAQAKTQVDSIYAEISGQVNAIVAPVKADVEKLKSQVTALQPKPPA